MQIQLKVSRHPSGRYTLMKREQNEMMFSDVQTPELLGNADMGKFYKAVASFLAGLCGEGHDVSYEDVQIAGDDDEVQTSAHR